MDNLSREFTGKTLIVFSIQILLVAMLLVIFKVVPSKFIFLYPLVAIPIITLALGLGLIVALLNKIVQINSDVGAQVSEDSRGQAAFLKVLAVISLIGGVVLAIGLNILRSKNR